MVNEVDITKPRIAVVEDEDDLRLSLCDYLACCGYAVWGVDSAEAFYKQLLVRPVDMVILDVGLPGESGLQVAQHLRELTHIEIIILSGRSSVDDRIAGLNQGAARYLVKPVDMRELLANIESATRARESAAVANNTSWIFLRAKWILQAPDGTQIALTTREFAFLDCLLSNERQAASRAELAQALIGDNLEGFDFHCIDMVVARLRQKIVAEARVNAPIKTEQGVGFIFVAECRVLRV